MQIFRKPNVNMAHKDEKLKCQSQPRTQTQFMAIKYSINHTSEKTESYLNIDNKMCHRLR